ncbi:hypothetical protein [Phyllobacterium bourgognense]|uniref:Uncharacterized protein n=1 Tax=Phyllobacterium bourgognense TaxID=314236 RepID=A0A368YHQ2_9HYPH|nr:hypothetical protein [Phyllobacterium bourgognense]RCW77704.1 hypothetical protein C7476_13911 [Phyllobacterium bourgognense]
MKSFWLATGLFFVIANSAYASETFDWPSQLQKSLTTFESGLGSSAKCERAGHTISFEKVDQNTTIEPDLFKPVYTEYNPFADQDDLSVDNTPGYYTVEGVATTKCEIGRQATANAYALNDRIFRIQLTFDRCESRDERPHGGTLLTEPIVYATCDGVDLKEQDFDAALYEAIKARNKYGYKKNGDQGYFDREWSGNKSVEYQAAEVRYVFDFNCNGRFEVEKLMRNPLFSDEARGVKCLIDIENSDLAHWTATAMYEVLKPGVMSDDIVGQYVSNRLFIDVPTEQKVIQSMQAELQLRIDEIKRQIAERVAEHETKEDAVSNILGGK